VLANPRSIFACLNAMEKFSNIHWVGRSRTDVVLYSSVVLNAVNTHTITGSREITAAPTSITYLNKVKKIVPIFICRFMLSVLPSPSGPFSLPLFPLFFSFVLLPWTHRKFHRQRHI